MRAGELRHQIEIQRYTETTNDFGETLKQWTTIYTVKASVSPISAREFFASEKVNTEVTHKVFMRYVSGLTPADRILFNDRIFNIKSIINYKEKNISLQLLCTE